MTTHDISLSKPKSPITFDWFSPIATLKGVGTKIAEKLAKLGIYTLGDLLLHCPYRYEDRTHLTPIKDLLPSQSAVIQGKIIHIQEQKTKKKRVTLMLADSSGVMSLLFFHYHAGQLKQWQKGVTLRCFGEVKRTGKGLQIIHPEYEIIQDEIQLPAHLTPVYSSVAGLSQSWLRKTIRDVLNAYIQRFDGQQDTIANTLSPFQGMLPWCDALRYIHCPLPDVNQEYLTTKQHPAFSRLIVEELMANHLSLQQLKQYAQAKEAKPLQPDEKVLNAFLENLPFSLTPAQQRVWQEIKQDMTKTTAMLRLVQGDVGCGKTVVAALGALIAVTNGMQVAVMAPTEILAEQHYAHFNQWFEKLGFRCELLVSKLKAKAKRSAFENITLGLTHIVIGTHALFQEEVRFHRLGLVIIDEQHRFGVHQRLALQMKGANALYSNHPHQLIMTATPIPRTLAMTHYAHLDISVIDSLPPGRQPITTLTIPQKRREEIIQRIKSVCQTGQQVYWVCTLIEESDVLEAQAAQLVQEELQGSLKEFRIGLVHGKLTSEEKESVMQAFYCGEIAILVATTVIEVGVNVPNATLMVIENPERLGLAQLHQLRGRVGRGNEKSYCVLLYQMPLSEMAQARLRIMRESCDGFVIAQADLDLRGPGEVLGVRQTGAIQFKIADLKRDEAIVQKIPFLTEQLSLTPPQIERIIQKWGRGGYYAQV